MLGFLNNLEVKMKVRIHRICKDNPLPTQGNKGDAGWDVYAAETMKFNYDEIKLIPLGIIAEAPEGYHFKLCIRSSMAYKRGYLIPNSPGIIDSAFKGENDQIHAVIKAPSKDTSLMLKNFNLINGSDSNLIIKKGERVAQLILEQNNDIEWDEQDVPDFAGDSRGGFGSTGI